MSAAIAAAIGGQMPRGMGRRPAVLLNGLVATSPLPSLRPLPLQEELLHLPAIALSSWPSHQRKGRKRASRGLQSRQSLSRSEGFRGIVRGVEAASLAARARTQRAIVQSAIRNRLVLLALGIPVLLHDPNEVTG